MSRSPSPTPRQVLVALNTARMSRATICRLSECLDTWFPMPGRPLRHLAGELGLPPKALEQAWKLVTGSPQVAACEERQAGDLGASILTRRDPQYPACLLTIPLPPPVLYCRGSLTTEAGVAIVGSRRPDAYGREAAAFFAREIAAAGSTVVSGFARGVDAAAHRGALEAPAGRTVAVLGCGLDVAYPRGHRPLADAIAARGAVISEFPCGAPPLKAHFPIRNRIIAALAERTLVVQATPRSGSLITARLALELGREVFALPGRIFDEASLGPNALLRDGAQVALHPADLVPESRSDARAFQVCGDAAPTPPLGELQTLVWSALSSSTEQSPEEVADALEAPVERILGALLELELGGWVERLPGPAYRQRYRR